MDHQADSSRSASSEKVNEHSEQECCGHKTFYSPERGFWHEPLTKAEARELWASADRARIAREQSMPDTKAAIRALFEAHQRLKELGWCEAQYCPKDGTHFEAIEPGSTGIFDCRYDGEWPDGHYLLFADGDVYCSRPILFRRYPEDEKRHRDKLQKAREKFRCDAEDELNFSNEAGSDGVSLKSPPLKSSDPQPLGEG